MDIPEYYAAYLTERIETINAMCDKMRGERAAFIFLTDYHGIKNTGHSPALIRRIADETGIDTLVFGGDAYHTSTNPEKKAEYGRGTAKVYSMLNSLTERFCPLLGNHEANHWKSNEALEWQVEETAWTRESLIRMCLRERDEDAYGDYAVQNARAQIVYVFIQIDGDHNSELGQFAWLAEVLNGVPEGWGVIVFRHFVYTHGTTANIFENRPRRNARMINRVLAAYSQRARKTIRNPTGNPAKENEKLTLDFRGAKGEVICIFGGHIHRDDHRTKEESTEGILTIITTADSCWKGKVPRTYVDERGEIAERTPGTVREQAFDVVLIDRKKRTVHCVRIGGGVDRAFRY